MKKKFKMPSQATLNKMHREHVLKTIPILEAKLEKTQLKLSRLQAKANREVFDLLNFVSMSGGKP